MSSRSTSPTSARNSTLEARQTSFTRSAASAMFCGRPMLLRGLRPLASPMRSIRGRLTIWLALLVVLSMVGFVVFLYAATTETLTGNVDRTLHVQGQQVASTYDF